MVAQHAEFRIVHVSPERDHIHLIVEADSSDALTRGVQAFEISAAQRLNRAAWRLTGDRVRGKVFGDRYHARFVTSPTQAHHAINYVLNNWRRHGQDETSIDVRFWEIDYMSSAVSFDGWQELEHGAVRFQHRVALEERLCVSEPRSWLLRAGWRKAGPISMYAVPGPDAAKSRKANRIDRRPRVGDTR